MADLNSSDDRWFYTQGGERNGPISIAELRELLATQQVDGETPVWRKGQSGWQPLRETDVAISSKDTPPPVAPSHINNGFVWALAFAPIAYMFVRVAIIDYQAFHIEEDLSISSALIWLIPALTNAVLCLLDENQLKRAGYSPGWMTLFALLLAPIYLFMRAQRLRQPPLYGYVWIACFIVSIIL